MDAQVIFFRKRIKLEAHGAGEIFLRDAEKIRFVSQIAGLEYALQPGFQPVERSPGQAADNIVPPVLPEERAGSPSPFSIAERTCRTVHIIHAGSERFREGELIAQREKEDIIMGVGLDGLELISDGAEAPDRRPDAMLPSPLKALAQEAAFKGTGREGGREDLERKSIRLGRGQTHR